MTNFTNLSYKSWLSILCPLITLIPVLTFVWSSPAEGILTLGAWLISNVMVVSMLWVLARMERSSLRRVTA